VGDSKIVIDANMNDNIADELFIKYLSNLHFSCKKQVRFGKKLDGGWDMCLADPYVPKSPCLIYSFGINNDFSFDDAVAATYNCTVRSFDPSMQANTHRRSANVWFYKIGIGGKDEVNHKNWPLKTLKSLLNMFNETDRTIDYLKMDVEGSEWATIVNIHKSGVLSKVRQFALEIHVGVKAKAAQLHNFYKTLRLLEDAGMRRWYYAMNYYGLGKTDNGWRSCCYEMAYINTHFLDKSRS